MDIVNQYFGIFFLIYQTSAIWGNLISSLVLEVNSTKVLPENTSYVHCGANNCPFKNAQLNNSTGSIAVTDNVRYTLMGIYTGCGVIAVLIIAIFLDPIDLREEPEKKCEDKVSIWKTLIDTIFQLKDIRQWLLIPLTMIFGMQQGFLSSDFTKSYVTCSLGIKYVGYVMICCGATNSITSMLTGKLSPYVGRISLFCLAAAVNCSSIIALLLWNPNPNQLSLFFILPALWSMSDAIRQTLLNTYYGVLFHSHKEAAYANYHVWQSLGFVMAFAYSNYFCVYVKLYIVLCVMLVGTILYMVVEYIEYRKAVTVVENTNTETPLESIPLKLCN